MKLRALMVGAGMALAACSPSGAPPVAPLSPEAGPPPTMSVSSSSCTAQGGEMQQVGRLQSWQCVIKYADAGKRCSDKGECQGDCLAGSDVRPATGAAARGFCAADSNRFGCRTTIRNGKADATLCID